ncbi:MAG: hypothetical protein WCV91_06945 [Candidatus Margulisiibacteriota bacterium]
MVSVGLTNRVARFVYVAAQKLPGIKSTFIQGEKKNAALNGILGFNSKAERLQHLAEHSKGVLKTSVEAELNKIGGQNLLTEHSLTIAIAGFPGDSAEVVAKSMFRRTPSGSLGGENTETLKLVGLGKQDTPPKA